MLAVCQALRPVARDIEVTRKARSPASGADEFSPLEDNWSALRTVVVSEIKPSKCVSPVFFT